ncbi:S49 family peptidase [Comamonas jiangduensis]|uniref:S49 family peptidase n=1 Tax=Comamonas jiangduensis TaxID=1194168 RepID=UPI003BF887D1
MSLPNKKKSNNTAPTTDELLLEIRDKVSSQNRSRLVLDSLRVCALLLWPIGLILMTTSAGRAPWEKSPNDLPHTAIVNVRGEIAAGSAADADRIIPAIKAAFENENSHGVILRINSPGGSPVPAGRIHDEILELRAQHPEKKVYAVIDDIGASGAYYIAVAANEIYANRASMIGSIGVISASFDFTGLMEKVGIQRRTLTAGSNKALLDPYSPMPEDQRQFWIGQLQQTHKQFIERVKDGRGAKLSTNESIFSGLIWNGEQALELGLIDGLASHTKVASSIVGQTETVDYSPRQDIFERFMGRAKVAFQTLVSSNHP